MLLGSCLSPLGAMICVEKRFADRISILCRIVYCTDIPPLGDMREEIACLKAHYLPGYAYIFSSVCGCAVIF